MLQPWVSVLACVDHSFVHRTAERTPCNLENGLLLRDSAGRETVLGDTVNNIDASVSSDVAVRRQLESFCFKLVDHPRKLVA